MVYEHLESGKHLELVFEVFEEAGHWTARLAPRPGQELPKAPTFYGTTREQAERQLRKVFDKEYELIRTEDLPD